MDFVWNRNGGGPPPCGARPRATWFGACHTAVTTPLIKDKGDDPETPLTAEEASAYRSIAMRIAYLAMDRPDLLRTSRELAKGLKEPTSYHWSLLKQAALYLSKRFTTKMILEFIGYW